MQKNNNLQIHNFEMTQKHFRIKRPLSNITATAYQTNKRQHADKTINIYDKSYQILYKRKAKANEKSLFQ